MVEIENYSYRKLAEFGKEIIPPVQRGLVWRPEQVSKLWDSIIRDLPIGSLMAYKENGKLQLLDGQQRYNAIRCGYVANAVGGYNLWAAKQGGELMFMVCSRSHPWGYTSNYDRFEYDEMDEFSPIMKNEVSESFESYYKLPELKDAYPMVGLKKNDLIFVPLCYVLDNDGIEEGWKKWINDGKNYRTPAAIVTLYKTFESNDAKGVDRIDEKKCYAAFKNVYDLMPDYIKYKLKKDDRSGCLIDEETIVKVPIQIVNVDSISETEDKNKTIADLFIRINTQGTALRNDEALYSKLCVLMGAEIKKSIEDLSADFMPPTRLAHWAVRLYLLLKGQNDKSILSAATEKDFNDVSKIKEFGWFCTQKTSECKLDIKTLEFYINVIKSIYKKETDSNSVSVLTYLEGNDNWITLIAFIAAKFPEIFIEDIQDNSIWFPLLAMLPDVVCSPPENNDCFIEEFYNSVKGTYIKYINCENKSKITLKQILIIGCIYTALIKNTFVFPYPSTYDSLCKLLDASNLKTIMSNWNRYDVDHYDIRPLLPYHNSHVNNNIMYYLQRVYLSYILQNIDAGSSEIWGRGLNKPFDVDHIFPQKHWPDSWLTQITPNKQVFYFRHNRKKGDRYSGVKMKSGQISINDLFVYPEEGNYSFDNLDSITDKEEKFGPEVVKRWKHIILKAYETLHIEELIADINSLALEDSMVPTYFPDVILASLKRYQLLQRFSEKVNRNLEWGAIIYKGKKRKTPVVMSKIPGLDYYHSLTPWLSLGESVKLCDDIPEFVCVTMGAYFTNSSAGSMNVEFGVRRGIGVSEEINHEQYSNWRSKCTSNRRSKYASVSDPWWRLRSNIPFDCGSSAQCMDQFIGRLARRYSKLIHLLSDKRHRDC